MPVSDLEKRASALRLVMSDNDGSLTDGTVLLSSDGQTSKRYSLRDGHGVELLRNDGVATAIVSREQCPVAQRRAEKLRLPHVFLGVQDKRAKLPELLATAGVEPSQVAYFGDDLNDLDIMRAIAEQGLCGAPADAHPRVAAAAHYVCEKPGGYGAFREFAEWLLALRGIQH
ncbi:KdsC family phosphatase [Haliangium ochraceum]|uniref:3-deoxy-D-manno-octulosonate 8-phosphate phosphatase, YrbI family n=1 Tax=Haliangium ochraceum (strain DSM 14365 / JCM 11303 / SMP-2) TaxID=502025 RepID=D0LIV7_HALO1|nr:HAD hydrolase family protein [Haliangium ochraceum]ACY12986.1 3-deoxy-D-manno-octulosonate 8-phosphate phosphatase, YrbI family [Haliangium ochraceum DSM 14365]